MADSKEKFLLKLAGHGIIGVFTGLLILHPASRLFHLLITSPQDFTLKLLWDDLLAIRHFTMHIYFMFLGAVIGTLHGLYAYRMSGLIRSVSDSSFMETVSRAYRHIFSLDIPETAGTLPAVTAASGPVEKKCLKGTPVSPGFFTGKAFVLTADDSFVTIFKKEQIEKHTMADFEDAIAKTRLQLNGLLKQTRAKGAEDTALIFEAHLLVLDDETFTGAVKRLIRNGETVSRAVLEVTTRYIDTLGDAEYRYMREKVHDLKDVVLRIMRNLEREEQSRDLAGRIVVGKDILPSDLIKMSAENVGGVVAVQGGLNSHTAIIARSLCLPAVMVDSAALLAGIDNSTSILLDGTGGDIYLNPSADTVAGITAAHELNAVRNGDVADAADGLQDVRTEDGKSMILMANINMLSDLNADTLPACAGIGLYRTEFSFLNYGMIPTEDEQYHIYRRVVERAPAGGVIFRAFDLGGDKAFIPVSGDMSSKLNPLLGVKSTRFLLRNKAVFKQQIKAILRACHTGPARIMFPMISSMDDFLEARETVEQCGHELTASGTVYNTVIETGVMIETPAVLDIIDDVCETADFISLGTNDLIQYLLAVDRTNTKLAEYYIPHHPAVLRALKRIADAALRAGKSLSVCGDMASDPQYLPFLIGIGIRQLSVEPGRLYTIRDAISAINTVDARGVAALLLAEGTLKGTYRLLQEYNAVVPVNDSVAC